MSSDRQKTSITDITGPGALRYGLLYVISILLLNTIVVGFFGVRPLTLISLTVGNALLLFYTLARYVNDLLAYHGLID